jgi:hypothetical protein
MAMPSDDDRRVETVYYTLEHCQSVVDTEGDLLFDICRRISLFYLSANTVSYTEPKMN